MNNHWMRGLAASAAVTLAVTGLAGPAQAAPSRLSPLFITRTAARPGVLKPALGPAIPGRLYSVAATSARDVWAVGLTSGPPLLLHWNGSSWLQYLISPNLYFNGVAAVSPRDAWAVGGTNWGEPTATVAYHWNGKAWRQVPTPTPTGSASFNGVAATSARNAWAVGATGPGPGGPGSANAPMIEHWNGKAWRTESVRVPDQPGSFASVTATSARNAWAVGWTGTTASVLIAHWNGRTWRQVPAPGGTGNLQGVTATGRANAWAAGFTNTTGQDKTLILHWNGRRWTAVPSPTPAGDTDLWRIEASSRSNAWAVGYSRPTSCDPECQTVAEHWNGRRWTAVPSPNAPAGFLNAFLGVVAISPRDAWAVGTTDWGSTLISHWNGRTWS